MIRLVDITKENTGDVLELSLSKEDQKMVAHNMVSLAEAEIEEHYYPKAIVSNGTIVGFLMYEINEEKHTSELVRLMIDEHHHRRGYARQALQLAIEEMKQYQIDEIKVCYDPNNHKAIPLYLSLGFVETEERVYDPVVEKHEHVAVFTL